MDIKKVPEKARQPLDSQSPSFDTPNISDCCHIAKYYTIIVAKMGLWGFREMRRVKGVSDFLCNFVSSMDRRHFCKTASLAVAFLGLGKVTAVASPTPHDQGGGWVMPCDCRVTVVRRESHTDLQAMFLDDPDTGPCSNFSASDCFSFKAGSSREEGFCPLLWATICHALSASPCSELFQGNVRLLSCPDGTRPVIIRVDL